MENCMRETTSQKGFTQDNCLNHLGSSGFSMLCHSKDKQGESKSVVSGKGAFRDSIQMLGTGEICSFMHWGLKYKTVLWECLRRPIQMNLFNELMPSLYLTFYFFIQISICHFVCFQYLEVCYQRGLSSHLLKAICSEIMPIIIGNSKNFSIHFQNMIPTYTFLLGLKLAFHVCGGSSLKDNSSSLHPRLIEYFKALY